MFTKVQTLYLNSVVRRRRVAAQSSYYMQYNSFLMLNHSFVGSSMVCEKYRSVSTEKMKFLDKMRF